MLNLRPGCFNHGTGNDQNNPDHNCGYARNLLPVYPSLGLLAYESLTPAPYGDTILEEAVEELGIITGQKPLITKARKSISGFKLRKGRAIGCKVTLRGDRMYEFLERLITFALPRVRDFRGLPRDSFDGRGNYSFGVSEQTIFPEVNLDKVDRTQGMNITICTSAKTDEEAFWLLKFFGFPFKQ